MRIDDPDIFRSISENLQMGLYLTDRARRIVFWNREAERITGYASHEVIGRYCQQGLLMHCDLEGRLMCMTDCPLANSMQDGMPREDRLYLHHKSGHRVPVRVRAFPVRTPDGMIIGAVEVFEEQSSALLSERREAMLAAHGFLDAATGLPNHAIVQSQLREHLNFYQEHHLPFGVLLIEVVGAKRFELAHSREALNAILHVIARSISHLLGPDCLLGHWSEDIFLALIPDSSLLELERLRKRIRELVGCSGIQWWGDRLSIAVQVGYASVEPADEIDALVSRAQGSLQSHATREQEHASVIVPHSGAPSGS